MTVKQMYDFFEDINYGFDDTPVIANMDGKMFSISNVIFRKDIDGDASVTIKMTEQPAS